MQLSPLKFKVRYLKNLQLFPIREFLEPTVLRKTGNGRQGRRNDFESGTVQRGSWVVPPAGIQGLEVRRYKPFVQITELSILNVQT